MSTIDQPGSSTEATQSTAPPAPPTATSAPTPAEAPTFKYYRPPTSTSASQPRELPESYFTPTAAELRAQQASLSARTDALVNAPLRTRVQREAEEKARHARWPQTTIRVKFSDRSQLEKTFPSTDKIKAVYAFVRGSLREDVKPIKFVLYQTPPKREFKVSDPTVRDLSLVDLQLAPSSMLLLRFEDDSLNHSDVPAPLNPSILAQAQDLPLPPNFDQEPSKDFAKDSGSASSSGKVPVSGSSASTKTDMKMPKWMKLGPKK
ncbi:hypothetical protein CERSUDRAFT_160206 [Gelatoporia subvermispora B]|uniref:UBX domain-containing protein n=1 Tax=Ceriporiopsis subvermispora (strain B) TaxID=914234 RepID=M2Q8X1_CERS8|nr:hypothetical protein CERSUDRAFT_160206 [Gelatoporia subvermispora B]